MWRAIYAEAQSSGILLVGMSARTLERGSSGKELQTMWRNIRSEKERYFLLTKMQTRSLAADAQGT
jgi:hypothetical protein